MGRVQAENIEGMRIMQESDVDRYEEKSKQELNQLQWQCQRKQITSFMDVFGEIWIVDFYLLLIWKENFTRLLNLPETFI